MQAYQAARGIGRLGMLGAIGSIGLAFGWGGPSAQATNVPLLDPGFDVFQAGTTTLIVDNRATNGPGSGPRTNAPLTVGSTAAATGELGDIPAGWSVQGDGNSTLRFRDDQEFIAPSGTIALFANVGTATFEQALGFPALPNTTYTLTIEVVDRDSTPITGGGGDVTSIAPTVGMELIADRLGPNQFVFPGLTTFAPPVNGGRSTMTRTVTTGSTVPGDNLTFFVFASGNSGAPATHTGFDNAALDVVPEPGTAGLLAAGALLYAGRRRRSV